MSIEVKNYHTNHGVKTVLVDDSGRKWMQVLMMNGQLVVVKVSNQETRYMSSLTGKQKSMATRVRQYRAYGRRNGMTKAAKSFLSKATKAA